MARIVIDANIAIALAITLPYSEQAAAQMAVWQAQEDELSVPTLWAYEVVTGLRKIVTANVLTYDAALARLEQIFALNIEIIPPSLSLHRRAFMWSEKIGQTAAYDAHYLALAEQLGAEFWMADKRLANSAVQAGIAWTHKLQK